MTPINLDGCFGWLHLPKNKQRQTGFVLCPGIKTDELCGYRSLRVLADALADRGFPVVRLHYSNTGDSVELSDTTDMWPIWQADVKRAIAWMRQNCGVADVALCGLRFGATLASVIASENKDVSGLVMLAPVLRGRTYMRQLRSDGYYAVGAHLTPHDIEAINNLDVKDLPPPNCNVLILAQSNTSIAVTDFIDSWKAKTTVTFGEFAGLECMLRPTFSNHEAEPSFDTLFQWLDTLPSRAMTTVIDRALPYTEIHNTQWAETPLMFGHNLFGMLCRPHEAENKVIVILGNSSADPHCAINIAGLARHLATKGIPSLRMDFAGVGDSDSPNKYGTHVFLEERSENISSAIDALETLGYQQFATEGLCSGAFHAYHAAMVDSRVTHTFLINLPFFEYPEGQDVKTLIFHYRLPDKMMDEMRTAKFWIVQWEKIRQGDFSMITNRWIAAKRRLFNRIVSPRIPTRKDVNSLYLVSEGDVSNIAFQRHFGAHVPANVKITLVDGMDHTMQRPGMCGVVAHHITMFLDQTASASFTNDVPFNRRQVGSVVKEVHL